MALTEDYWQWRSWLESANDPTVGFPLQGLPYCAFVAEDAQTRLGVGIGSFVLDLRAASEAGFFSNLGSDVEAACRSQQLNELMTCGSSAWTHLRIRLMELFHETAGIDLREQMEKILVAVNTLHFRLPLRVANYTDFYASIEHATNVGRLFRPESPLLPNYRWLPIGYHGRASSIVVSGTEVWRPYGQLKMRTSEVPTFRPTLQLDYELELAAYVGLGNELGEAVPIAKAEERLFGISLLNDWSARDLQIWEAQPLGPFLGKNFATSVSAWVMPLEALEPYRVRARVHHQADPNPLNYLSDETVEKTGAFDATLEVWLSTAEMRVTKKNPVRVSQVNAKELYWTFAQMVAHHTSNGCNLVAGDVLGSGTVSGREADSAGCLLEMTECGAKPLQLPNGEVRKFLEDGDEVILRGFCEREGFARLSLGECRGLISPARTSG